LREEEWLDAEEAFREVLCQYFDEYGVVDVSR
jgi:hypothetical protein